jgi:glutamyl-tRNA synthetase
MAELIEKFSLDHIHKNNAVFNFDANDPRHWTDDKVIWMNAEYVRTMPVADLLPFVKAELKSAKLWRDEYEDDDRQWFENTINLIRQRFFTLKDFSTQGRAFFSEDFDFDKAAIDKNLKKFPDLQIWLPELADRLESVEDFTHDSLEAVIKNFTEEKGTKMGVIMNGARALLTGLAVGPSMLAVFETLGKEKTVRRLKSQIVWNQ